MKKINFSIITFFCVMFSTNSWSNWTEVTTNMNGDTFYTDLTKIIMKDKVTLFWVLIDSSKKASSKRSGIKSVKTQQKCECISKKYKTMSWFFHEKKMGEGKSTDKSKYYADHFFSPNYWTYPSPGSSEEKVIELICNKN